jgi:hypothetical protein
MTAALRRVFDFYTDFFALRISSRLEFWRGVAWDLGTA